MPPTTKKKASALIAPEAPSAEPQVLERIKNLAKRQREIQEALDKNEADRKELNKEFEKIAGGYQNEGELVKAMQEAAFEEFTLEDGIKVVLNKEIQPPTLGATSKHREKVIAWLKQSGHEDLIKSELKAQFSQDEGDDRLAQTVEALTKLAVPFDQYETANANSFKALIKELLEEGEPIPIEDLGIFIYKQTEVKIKKSKKEAV